MATVDEVLSQMEEESIVEEDVQLCKIDGQSRIIFVPAKYMLLGVESDEHSARIPFKCKKIVGDNVDLSKMQLYVNYKNANEEKDTYIVTDVSVDGEYITFSWILSRKVTAYKGFVKFIVCARKADNEGNIIAEWNTTLAMANVLEGLETDNIEIDEDTKDIVLQLINLTNKTIEDKGKEVIESIPDEYTDLVEKVDRIESDTEAEFNELKEDLSQISEEIENLPFIDVTTASAMSDTKKIYRYEGTEDGYTEGALYYYDKTQWKRVGTGSNVEDGYSYKLPDLYLVGDDSGMSHDDAVQMQYTYFDQNTNKQRTGWCTVKWQGDSSLQYDKKNYTIKFFHDINAARKDKIEFFDGVKENKCVIKANWIDHSHARNIVSARLWGNVVKSRHTAVPDELFSSYNYGAIDGFPIKVYLNKLYHGLYTLNIPKDDFTFGMDENNPLHCAVGANYQGGTAEFRANGDSILGWEAEVPDELSAEAQTALLNAIKFVTNATDEEFKAELDNYIDVESAIDYYLFMYFIGGTDNLVKNIIMLTYDMQKWYMHAYDLDSTFGGRYNGGTFYPYNVACPEGYQGTNSLLWERMEALFGNELYSRYRELRASVFDVDYICRELEQFVSLIPEDEYVADADLWTDVPHKGEDLLKQMQTWITNRADYVDIEIANLVDPVNATSIILNTSEYEFTSTSDSLALFATVEPETSTDIVTWESSDETVASVSSTGVVKPTGSGSCIITATAGTVSATCVITVMEGIFESGAMVIKLVKEGYGFNNGNEVMWSDFSISDMTELPIGDYNALVVTDYIKEIVFYDENENRISYVSSASTEISATLRIVIPSGAKYFRISAKTAAKTNKYVVISTGNTDDYVLPVVFSESAIYKANSDGSITEDGSYYMAEINNIPDNFSRLLFLGRRPYARQCSYILYDVNDNIIATNLNLWVNSYDDINTATSATTIVGCVSAVYNVTADTYGKIDHAKLLILPEGTNVPEAAVCYR